ncbi:MAG: radical SAM family heme chaperone HemW [Planctomycetes bacterium]|nr:radical SAM family heme chaperone HemW [Planctomycetota bacterium]
MTIATSPGLYVHIPFCRARCGYCTFTSSVYSKETADRYVAALCREVAAKDIVLPSTVFIGGGTPTALSMAQLDRVLAVLPEPAPGAEYTCEVNPDTATREKLALLRSYGVNRLSFGVQTFSPDGLRVLGRCHDSQTAAEAVTMALEMGFPAVNLDLIHGWPGQTEAFLLSDLEQAIGLGVHHLSTYSLILDESASRYEYLSGLLGHADSDSERFGEFFQTSHDYLTSHQFKHYETSNYARPGFICRHNWNIWRGGEYWGIGLAAHSHHQGRRYATTGDMTAYLENAGMPSNLESFSETLDDERKARETAVFWLRLYEGIDLAEFSHQTGFDFFDLYATVAPPLLAKGWLEHSADHSHIRVPEKLQPVLDTVLVELI